MEKRSRKESAVGLLGSFTIVVNYGKRTTFKAALALQKCEGDEASDVPDLSSINSNIQGFVHEHRDGLEVRRLLQRVCHDLILPEKFGAMYLQLICTGFVTNEEATTI